ncbi:MAG: glutamine synthetase beta-grasp domain-containing protein [Myxococcota bacterium]|nr:glutamine synthetase beta-grasp domain-containing protein [Myxococcota bacterium]
MTVIAEYIWFDGGEPTRQLRSKTRVLLDLELKATESGEIEAGLFPDWGFDGSSTGQAEGEASDCKLNPVRVVPDPTRSGEAYLVLCEVLNPATNEMHPTNTRAGLRRVLDAGGAAAEAWMGIEQEYTIFKGSAPLGFPSERRFPAPQGPYYCGVGADEVFGRDLVEDHMEACLHAGLLLCGINAEVMPGQWEFQIGGPGGDPLRVSDHLWLARWLLYRIGEDYGMTATLDPKPVPGDWNGAGAHTNFSTKAMREEGGIKVIEAACEAIGQRIDAHLEVYGDGLESRLTGRHETCSFREYRYAVGDRTASIRIPAHVQAEGKGYLEDRRPCANIDPYEVSAILLKTVCNID